MINFNLIVAKDIANGIGRNGKLAWNLPKDIAYFKKITSTVNDKSKINAVIMGKNTWNSIPEKFKPLPNRLNCILSRKMVDHPHYQWKIYNDFNNALNELSTYNNIENIFVIGGEKLYKTALNTNGLKYLYITDINNDYQCDKFFPTLDNNNITLLESLNETDIDNNNNKIDLKFNKFLYTKMFDNTFTNTDELQYLNLVNNVIENGKKRTDRTGVGTRSIFGTQMRFDISKYFPLLTTKKVFWKGVAEELLWFLNGDTNVKTLQDKGVHIWDGNSTKEYLESIGLNYENGELGPIYGFQWRHFGGQYPIYPLNNNHGYDQIKNIIKQIKEDPDSRRIILSAWNPPDIQKMALPPCHVLYQFYVNDDKLSCSMYQRSGDLGLGIPFNIASASLLTYIIAKHTDLKPDELIHTIGDAHVYENHIDALKIQLERTPREFPILEINNNKYTDISQYKFDDFILKNYNPYSKIKMEMAV